jgi:hypothetical protein
MDRFTQVEEEVAGSLPLPGLGLEPAPPAEAVPARIEELWAVR